MTMKEIDTAIKSLKSQKEKIALLAQYTGHKTDKKLCERYGVEFAAFSKAKKAFDAKQNAQSFAKKIADIQYFAAKKGVKISQKVIQKLQTLVTNSVFDTDHAMGYEANIYVDGVEIASFEKKEVYAKSCKYSPTYGYTRLNLTKKEALAIEDIGGVLTIQGEKHAAKWLFAAGTKHSHSIRWMDGFVVGTSHAQSIAECIELERLKQQKATADQKRSFKIFGVDHLRKIGACMPGIEAAAKTIGIDLQKIGGIRVDFALELAKKAGVEKQFQSYLSRV